MPVSPRRIRWVGRATMILLNAVVALMIAAALWLVYLESGWSSAQFRDPGEAFRHGTIGTEVMPLPVALTLPALAPHHFQPAGPEAGEWVDQFGFLRDPEDDNGLPIGFAVSNYRPGSAAPSPVPFVGFSCALCHTTAIRTAEAGEPRLVQGPGSVSLNLFAWLDAFQAALLERDPLPAGETFDPADPPPYRLSADDFIDAYEADSGTELDTASGVMVGLWLDTLRATIEDGLPRFDDPYGNGLSRDETVTPTGPTRTLPFRTLVRRVLNRPANDLAVYTKIATVFSQDLRPRAQFDGGIADLYARSSLAALAAGATPVNMANPEIVHNIRAASTYTTQLRAPAFAQLFPDHVPDDTLLGRGEAVYREHCFSCHGGPAADGAWEYGPRTNTVIGLEEIGTDPQRVMFRHFGTLPGRLHAVFGPEHPFVFDREDIFPLPGDEEDLSKRGYLAAAIDGAYLRAPFLHNASVPSLAALIHLETREPIFYRGQNLYDPETAGFIAPSAADAERYFKFDTSQVGNSNAGHDYPWAPGDEDYSEADLEALLVYLKTL